MSTDKKLIDPASDAEIETARRLYQCDDVEIDDIAETSRADYGFWVAAWVWITNDDCQESEQ